MLASGARDEGAKERTKESVSWGERLLWLFLVLGIFVGFHLVFIFLLFFI